MKETGFLPLYTYRYSDEEVLRRLCASEQKFDAQHVIF